MRNSACLTSEISKISQETIAVLLPQFCVKHSVAAAFCAQLWNRRLAVPTTKDQEPKNPNNYGRLIFYETAWSPSFLLRACLHAKLLCPRFENDVERILRDYRNKT